MTYAPEAPVEPCAGGGATYVDDPPELLELLDDFFFLVDDPLEDEVDDDPLDPEYEVFDFFFFDEVFVPLTMESACFFNEATVLRRAAT